MPTLTTTLFYDSSEAQSVLAAHVVENYHPTVSVNDTASLNEASIDALIAAIGAATQHRIFILVGVAAGHVAGDITDAQIVTLDTKLIGATDPTSDTACRQLGVASANKNPCLRAWENLYTTSITPPLIIFYLGGTAYTGAFPLVASTASGGTSTTLVDSGETWTADDHIGSWVYIVSGTGVGQYAQITDNDTTSVTFASWSDDIGLQAVVNSDNTSVYRIIQGDAAETDPPRALFADVWLPYVLTLYYPDVSNSDHVDVIQDMIDEGQNVVGSGLQAPEQDLDLLDDILTVGKNCFEYANL